MRDPKRIKRLLNKLEKVWSKQPDIRLYQLLINLGLLPDGHYWNIEDTDIEEVLDLLK